MDYSADLAFDDAAVRVEMGSQVGREFKDAPDNVPTGDTGTNHRERDSITWLPRFDCALEERREMESRVNFVLRHDGKELLKRLDQHTHIDEHVTPRKQLFEGPPKKGEKLQKLTGLSWLNGRIVLLIPCHS